MQITLSSAARNKLEQILDNLSSRFDVEELSHDELVDALINHAAGLITSEDKSMIDCRDRLVKSCGLKVGLHLGTGGKFDENEEYRG